MADARRTRDLDELDALLARRAIEPLLPAEIARLAALESRYPEHDREGYERAAAAVLLAMTRINEQMPASLERRLRALGTGRVTDAAGDRSDEH